MDAQADGAVALSAHSPRRLEGASLLMACLLLPFSLAAQQTQAASGLVKAPIDSGVIASHDSVTIRLINADLRAAIEALAPFVDRPVVFGTAVSGGRVTFTTPHPVPRPAVRDLLRGMLESQQFELVADSTAGLYRVQAKPPTVTPPPPSPANASPGVPGSMGPVQLFVIHLRHARAADVAATVNALFGRASALGELGSAQPSTLSQQLTATQVPPMLPGQALSAAVPGLQGRQAQFQGEVTIVPDARTNSLLIRAGASDFALIQAAVKELDTRPLQVLIEVTIAELQRNRQFSFGVDASLPTTSIKGSPTTISATQLGLGGAGDFVLQVMHLGHVDIDATLAASAERGDVRILSQPVILAENNEPATINVGSQRPFIQVSRSLPTDAATRDQVVEYKDVGTKLTVQPTISPDGSVVLAVTQEVNNATTEVAFGAPVISTRSVQTQLLIKDGQTVAIGGLSDREHDVNQGGIPFLSAIPWIGGLFGRANRSTSDTELFLFLTPHVIQSDADVNNITAPLKKRADKIKP